MNVFMMLDVMRRRRILRSREQWSRGRLAAHRAAALALLRAYAVEHSPFYRRLHAGLEDLPQCVTDRRIRLADVESYLSDLKSDERFLGRYWVSATSGSTGRRGVILSDYNEWTTMIASYARANEWSGIRVDLLHPMKVAVVSSTAPWHQSARVGATLKSRLVPTLRLSATDSIASIDTELTAFQPQSLVAYSSMVRALAVDFRGQKLPASSAWRRSSSYQGFPALRLLPGSPRQRHMRTNGRRAKTRVIAPNRMSACAECPLLWSVEKTITVVRAPGPASDGIPSGTKLTSEASS